jgi:hypothetical protein
MRRGQANTGRARACFVAHTLVASAVIVGIVVMHALIAPRPEVPQVTAAQHVLVTIGHDRAGMPASSMLPDRADHGPAHGLHAGELCLAVLGGVLVVAVLIFGLRRRARTPLSLASPKAQTRLQTLLRGPPTTSPSLAELCLLRI